MDYAMKPGPPLSPVLHLVRTNCIPSLIERKLACEAASAAGRKASQIQLIMNGLAHKIAELTHIYAKFEKTEHELRVFESDHIAVATPSPARALPEEILREIILHIDNSGPDLLHRGTSSNWKVIHVCSRWRAIALSMPEIWRNIRIYDTTNPIEGSNKVDRLLNLWLDQPNDSINVQIIWTENEYKLKTIIANSYRWQTLEINASLWRYYPYEMSKIKGNIAGLRSCVMKHYSGAPFSDFPPLIAFSDEALHDALNLSFIHSEAYHWLVHTKLPFNQITNLELTQGSGDFSRFSCSIRECIDMIRKCSRLVSCILDCSIISRRETPNLGISHILNTCLKDLTVTWDTRGLQTSQEVGLTNFFDAVTFPNLSKLAIRSPNTSLATMQMSLNNFLNRGQLIQSFVFEDIICQSTCACHLPNLRLIAGLKHLRLVLSRNSGQVIVEELQRCSRYSRIMWPLMKIPVLYVYEGASQDPQSSSVEIASTRTLTESMMYTYNWFTISQSSARQRGRLTEGVKLVKFAMKGRKKMERFLTSAFRRP